MLIVSLTMLALVPSQSDLLSQDRSTASETESEARETSPDTQSSEIVVEGERSEDPMDAGNRLPKVILGSRIPRQSSQNNPYIASATSLGGLTPGSGMDPFANDRTLRWKSCKVDGYSVGAAHACMFGKAQKAIEAQQWGAAQAIAADLAAQQDISVDGQYLAQRMLYTVAAATGDQAARRRSLSKMVTTGLMPAADERAALRTLAAMAITAGDTADAIGKYRDLTILDSDDYQSRVNLGSLLQQNGDVEESKVHFLAAIQILERNGQPVPEPLILNSR